MTAPGHAAGGRRAFGRFALGCAVAFAGASLPSLARADAVADLQRFVREVRTARADFSQTVTSPDGSRQKTSSGRFAFARPDRFRFVYLKPFEQTIVGDGRKVWIHDPDLNQVSSRPFDQAIGATPAALLAGGDLERDFTLLAQPPADGLDWVEARPRAEGGTFQSLRVGFESGTLAALEILDSFGQRSMLRFARLEANVDLPADEFRFKVPAGADVIEQ